VEALTGLEIELPRRLAFTDTSALFALTFTQDQFHVRAKGIGERLFQSGLQLVTSNFVVAEFHALLVNRVSSHAANMALKLLDHGSTRILSVQLDDELRARAILETFPGNGYTLTDATSFAIME
jgi:predicted nucleic acid-binding protein